MKKICPRILGVEADRVIRFEIKIEDGRGWISTLKLSKNAVQTIEDVIDLIGKEVNMTVEGDEITKIELAP